MEKYGNNVEFKKKEVSEAVINDSQVCDDIFVEICWIDFGKDTQSKYLDCPTGTNTAIDPESFAETGD